MRMTPSQQRKQDNLLCQMIYKDYQPFSVVENDGFRAYSKGLNPSYEIIGRKQLAQKLLPEKFEEVKLFVMNEVQKAKSVSLTTDCWTDSSSVSYITVTLHYVDDNFKLKTYNLETSTFTERHTAENLLNFLKLLCNEWNITNKVKLVLSDNAANIVAALRLSDWSSMGCNAHKLNLIVQNALKLTHVAQLRNKVTTIHFQKAF